MSKRILKSDNKNTRNSKKQFNKYLKRKNKVYTGGSIINSIKNNQEILPQFKYANDIEKFCEINSPYVLQKKNNIIKFNADFSLFKDPNKVLKTLLEMLNTAKTSQGYTTLKYEGKVSFGSLFLVDNFCWEIAKKRKWKVKCENITESEKEKISNLKSIDSSSYESEKAYMINEKVRINRSGDAKADQSYKVKAKEITDLLNCALKESHSNEDYKLSFKEYQAINSTIGEHFDNIVLHAKDADLGYLCGFYDKEQHEVTLLIYNFGNTIAETLLTDELPEQIKAELLEIIENHQSKKFFELKNKYSPENALTLLAIQEGISSRVQYDKSRGHGLIDFIEHCFMLNNNCKIVLISGNTAIKMDKKYNIEQKNVFNRQRRILALNDANDIYEKPDNDYVINMNYFFPGVLIETTIPLI